MRENKKWIEIDNKIKIGRMQDKRSIIRFMWMLILSLSVYSIAAQDIEVKAPKEVLKGETFQIKYDIYSRSGINKMPKLLDAKDYKLLREPQIKESRPSPFWGRNYYTQRIIYTLKANKTGNLKLPRIELEGKRGKITSEKGIIEVLEMPEMEDVELFVEVIPTKQTMSEGDTLTLSYKLYSTKEITRIINVDIPRNRNFYYHDITPRRIQMSEERVNGVDYKVYTIASYILQARSIGTIEMPSGEIHVEYTYPTGRKKTDAWGQTYDEQLREVRTCTTEHFILRVHNMMSI